MRFNTITFDANLPTVQQVNVPTNSDYKIGMKVKRNGSVQSIKPSEFTITAQDGTTLSADPDKTNGYVTITKASGDNASFKQYGVHIEHGYDYNDEYREVGQWGSTAPNPNPADLNVTAGDLGIDGMVLKPSYFQTATIYQYRAASEPPATGLTGWRKVDVLPPGPDPVAPTMLYTFSDLGTIGAVGWGVMRVDRDVVLDENNAAPELVGTVLKAGSYHFVKVENIIVYGWKILELADTHTFASDEPVFYKKSGKYAANYWWGKMVTWTFGTPFSADFKLNINEFKSQSGDIAETLADGNYVNVDGTYADGTTFSFDFCTK